MARLGLFLIATGSVAGCSAFPKAEGERMDKADKEFLARVEKAPELLTAPDFGDGLRYREGTHRLTEMPALKSGYT